MMQHTVYQIVALREVVVCRCQDGYDDMHKYYPHLARIRAFLSPIGIHMGADKHVSR